jgi:hypothetical protein
MKTFEMKISSKFIIKYIEVLLKKKCKFDPHP